MATLDDIKDLAPGDIILKRALTKSESTDGTHHFDLYYNVLAVKEGNIALSMGYEKGEKPRPGKWVFHTSAEYFPPMEIKEWQIIKQKQ